MPDDVGHIPVLLQPVLSLLDPQVGEVCVDGTVGRGGHAGAIVPRLGSSGRYVGLDVDPVNLDFARQRLADAPCRVDLVHANFTQIPAVLASLGVASADLLLADLGFSSNQMDDAARGFSFSQDGPLDMRLDPRLPRTAADLVAELSERELADLIYQLGEEPFSRRIARKIVEYRRNRPINTTADLAQVVRAGYGPRAAKSRNDPATRTFMALRIAVNGELDALASLLAALPHLLTPGGRAALISFHSLEDRQVKHALRQLRIDGRAQLLTRKPIIADDAEQRANPRSRSAKLRAVRMNRPEENPD